MRPIYFRSTSKVPVLFARKSSEVVCATGCIATRDHLTVTSRFNSAVIYVLTATHFTYSVGMEVRVELVYSGDRTRNSWTPAHMSKHVSERLTP